MTKKPVQKPLSQENRYRTEDLVRNMNILKNMINRCDYLYAQKTADISRGLERDFTEGNMSLDIYQHYNNEIEKSVREFGEKCHCSKKTVVSSHA